MLILLLLNNLLFLTLNGTAVVAPDADGSENDKDHDYEHSSKDTVFHGLCQFDC
jgi:hypothetical protein